MPIPKNFSSPARMSAKERAFNQLQRWIIDGTLEPGEKIYDMEIAQALGISRTPTREALQLLEVQGFIETYPGRETRVTMIKKQDVLKIYPPLASLQALAAEEAAKIISLDQVEKLKDINKRYEEAIISKQPFKAMEYDEEFHNLIIDIADNSYISHFSSILQLHIRRFKYVFLNKELTHKKDSLQEHEILLQAFSDRNPQLAKSIMEQNWLRPMNEVYHLL
ncbi:GntR family transcriptional regulator [Bacillus litorisediminis]|uniref:GntR family transcriptional regulator n=1 Tax=Bacillus litorisediminis TaxID=2922713 RepID=UPI001FAF2574|nr:GntR family transcriptional regulator [Bacillus litorisediminis]